MPGPRKKPRRARASSKQARRRSRKAAAPAGRKGRAAVAKARPAPSAGPAEAVEGAADPAGFFVARVRGEEAVRDAPHLLSEAAADTGVRVPEGVPHGPALDERLGELPWGYGDDAVVAMPRDPRSIYLYWDHAEKTLRRGFDGLDHPRAQLWLFARQGGGWERIRELEVALESRGYYLHDLEPGRTYRAELHAVDRAGRERPLGPSSGEVPLPPLGPSPVIDDRFVELPWDRPLGGPPGPEHGRPPFPDDAREALARLSGWSRAGHPHGTCGSMAGGMGGRPRSPAPGGEGER